MAAQFLIERDASGQFVFCFVAVPHGTLLRGGPFGALASAAECVEHLRRQLLAADWAHRQHTADGAGYRFAVRDAQGRILATSIPFASRFAQEIAIERLGLDGPSAAVVHCASSRE